VQLTPIVDARGLHKHFGALHVLKEVDLRVAERELVFVIGPSGSGKSTLLRCLNRLEEPSSGSVVVDGIDMLDPRTETMPASASAWCSSPSTSIRT
jgi:polar amino acid transport system ATP-binding protein